MQQEGKQRAFRRSLDHSDPTAASSEKPTPTIPKLSLWLSLFSHTLLRSHLYISSSLYLAPHMDDSEILERSPTLVKLKRKRLAPSRLAELLAAGRAPRPPKDLDAWECCGSSCNPCTRTLRLEEKKVWNEVNPDGVDEEEEEAEDEEGDKAEGKEGEKDKIEGEEKENVHDGTQATATRDNAADLALEGRDGPLVAIALEQEGSSTVSSAEKGVKSLGEELW